MRTEFLLLCSRSCEAPERETRSQRGNPGDSATHRTEVPQLLRVGDRAYGLDEVVGDIEGDDQNGLPLGVEEDGPGVAVDLRV